MLRQSILYSDVIRRLGVLNSAYIAWYRFTLKTKIRKILFPRYSFVTDKPFFNPTVSRSDYFGMQQLSLIKDADKIVNGEMRHFAYHWMHLGNPPNWFLNYFNGKIFSNHLRHWTEIKDFDFDVGDIKNIWEPSRFEWTVTLAKAFAVSGKSVYIDTLNCLLKDWAEKNPLNIGPNWKCGQESSLRVFNLMYAALILDQVDNPTPILLDFIYRHLERIAANIRYAIAQDNNHGTSEAAALFIGGYWCAQVSGHKDDINDTTKTKNVINTVRQKKCLKFAQMGRKWLENRVGKLIATDGSFSQHSVTYHRVLLDTLIFVEYWRKKLNLHSFSNLFYQRCKAAIYWLYQMTDDISGQAPNLGANDGAMFLNLHACDYRDFRPSIQTASRLFNDQAIYAPGQWDEPSWWLGLETVKSFTESDKKVSRVIPGGYVVMRGKDSWGLLRFPMFRFRPGHDDIFHFDFWYKGENVLQDGGSYSYAADEPLHIYFTGTASHNTIQFDGHDHMPRLGRFLFGNWIKTSSISAIDVRDGMQTWSGSCRDAAGCFHKRTVSCNDSIWEITDEINGYKNSAVLRWRLKPDDWRIEGNGCMNGNIEINIHSDVPINRFDLVEGFESFYYHDMSGIPVLEIEVKPPKAILRTRIRLKDDHRSE